jgi:hypothetical protein
MIIGAVRSNGHQTRSGCGVTGRRDVKGREAATVELQWCRLQEMEMGKGRQ